MNRKKVVLFAPQRTGMARRGAPDKRQEFVLAIEEVECPRCGAVLCFEAGPLHGDSEILCAGCSSVIPPVEPRRADSR